ncbi:MAG: restriction endonuclease [Candidatus Brocadia sp. WS118]|nr:MAG: restriction endonuclease [Candidatus Brocadia sp. WS118]
MTDNSQVMKLKDVIKLEYGKPLDESKRDINGLYPVYGANGEKARSNEYYFDKKSIIIGRKGSAGEINITTEKFWPLDVTYFITFDDKKYNLKFLFHLLSTLNLSKLAKGVKPGINRNDVYSLEVSIPPLPEQKRIVKILDEALSAIEQAKTNAEKNLQNSRELFDAYLNKVFDNPGDDWEEKRLNQISDNLDSRRVPITKSKRVSGKYPYYGASGIVDYVNDYLFDEDLLLISEDGANLLARTTPIAFSVSGKIWVNNHAHILRFENLTTQKYVEMYFASIKLDEYITGTAQPKLNQSALNSIRIPVPPPDKQKQIIENLLSLSTQTKKLESLYQQKLTNLEELKKSILQKAFNGEL